MRTPSTASQRFTRRSALAAAAATAGAGATALLPTTSASAAAEYQPRPWARGSFDVPPEHVTQLPDAQTSHILRRFTGGVTPARVADVAAAGGVYGWFERQLAPGKIPDHQASDLWSWFPILALTPLQRWKRYEAGTEQGWEMMQDLANWVMLRRLLSRRQVQEMMVDFWSDLLHVASPAANVWVWRVEYEQLIRRNALGRFDDLLTQAIQHPAMGLYLSNVESTADAINENLGRELLECHTVGLDGGYTEAQVIDSARILTGFHVDSNNTWAPSYIPANHWVGRVKVMGFSSPNSQHDGRPVLKKYLSYLAHHPSTAKRLCGRLAVRFVSDTPSVRLVNSLAKVYLDSDTQIIPVLRALVRSDEFRASAGKKLRTPVEDAVATWTAIGAGVAQPHHLHDAGNQFINFGKAIGQVVYDWPAPNGFPDVAPAWTSSGRLLGSMRAHWMAASGVFPNQGITYRTPMDWMPKLPTTFDNVVDYVARSTLFMECTPTMLKAACVATDIEPKEVIYKTHPLITYKFPHLLVSILDSTEHLSR